MFYPNNLSRPGDAWPKSKNASLLPFVDEEPAPVPDEAVSPPFQGSARSALLTTLEAVLFLAREPLSSRRLAQIAEFPEGTRIRNLLKELNELYDAQQSAFRIVEVAGGFQLRTRPEFASWLVRLQEVPETVRLSMPVQETLAVIAYRQPVARMEIERIRGVHCGELIRQLLDRDLVRIVGRSEELGRPRLYGTTKTFLQVFGLGRLQDLPDFPSLRRPEPDAGPDNFLEGDAPESEA